MFQNSKVLANKRWSSLKGIRCYFQGSDDKARVPDSERYIARDEVERFMVDCMKSVGAAEDSSKRLAANLAEADVIGHFSHGLNRLAMYVSDIQKGLCDAQAVPKILKQGPSTAWIDGCNGLGVVVGEYSMNIAIQKAKETGIGWVCAKGSNHFGICQWYTAMATRQNLLGIASTNTSPLVAPTRGKDTIFGTNPIAFAANAKDQDGFVLDMATSTVAVGKIEMQMRKKEPLPSLGWALGAEGQPTTNAEEAFYHGKGLMPLGGLEVNSGYKGYGLAMVVEMLCGIMSGSHYAHNVRHWTDYTDQLADLGHFFVALDPECFAPGFSDRLQDLMNHLRGLEPAEPNVPVLVPGDPEKIAHEQFAKTGAIFYTEDHIKTYQQLAHDLNVKPMQAANLK